MKIAHVAPLYESVPPKLYGGTERVVSYLTEELIDLGHDVTLFASGDSKTRATLISTLEVAIRLNPQHEDQLAPHIVQLQNLIEHAKDFDIIHFHNDYLHYPISENISIPHLTTLHGKLNIPELQLVYNTFKKQPVVSISNDQRIPVPQANFIGTVYHGLPIDLHKAGNGDGGYLAFLGRFSPEKGVKEAINWASLAGIPLKIAAKIDKADEKYFHSEIKPLLNNPIVEFIGEINEKEKTDFLGKAKALLFPIDWNEPFGLVLIEAMACGTPVIAYGKGSVPEVIENGKSGYIVGSTSEAVRMIHQLHTIPREKVRKTFEERFTSKRMAKDYLKLYEMLCGQERNINKEGYLSNKTAGQ